MELKKTMTIDEMTLYMKEHSFILPNRVTIGRYAKQLGYKVYKPMQNGKLFHFYVRDDTPQEIIPEENSN